MNGPAGSGQDLQRSFMETIVCASHNPNKVKEIAKITKEFGFDVITRDEAGVPLLFDVIEDGKTFAGFYDHEDNGEACDR